MTTTVRERPILFSAPMVRSILDGRKTQTRRVVEPQPDKVVLSYYPGGLVAHDLECNETAIKYGNGFEDDDRQWKCPYGAPGDRLWVRETWQQDPAGDRAVCYRATGHDEKCVIPDHLWRPSIFMPRWASRLTLGITAVRVQRLQEISEDDAIAEGCKLPASGRITDVQGGQYAGRIWWNAVTWYKELWDSINGKTHPWTSNPWVWVIEFRGVEA